MSNGRAQEAASEREQDDGLQPDFRDTRNAIRKALPHKLGALGPPGGQQTKLAAPEPGPPFRFAGFLGTIVSALLFSLGVLCVKLMPLEPELREKTKIIMIRGVSLMVLAGATILAQKSTLAVRRNEIAITLVRSVAGFFGHFGIYVAIHYITIAEASALAYSSPLWTCMLGYLLLGERLPLTLVLAIPLGALALVLIGKPPELELAPVGEPQFNSTDLLPAQELAGPLEEAADERWLGVLLALLTSLVLAVINICLKLRRTTPIPTTTFYLGLSTSLLAAAIQALVGFGAWPAGWLEWSLHLAIGVCSYLGQALLQWSLQYESASMLSVVRTVDIVFSFLWSALILREQILPTSVLGAALIALVVALIMFNDQVHKQLRSCLCCWRRKS